MSDPNADRPGYKETKVGWVPLEWNVRPYSEVFVRSGNPVKIKDEGIYREIGVRSHGKGIFHKPPVTGKSVGDKRVYWVEPDRLMFNIVFAWEQAIAVSSEAENGFIASHRFPMYKAIEGCNSHFIAWFLRTSRGKHLLGIASPGGAGRNRTLGQAELEFLLLPLPRLPEQEMIAIILSACEEVIEKTSDLIETKQQQKKALMQQLLTGKKRLPGYEGDWGTRQISSVLTHVFRPVEWAPSKLFHLVSIRRRSMGLFRRQPLRGDEYKTTDLHELKTGDFLVSKRQVTHGALAMVTDEFEGCHVSKEYSIFTNKDPKGFYMPFFDWLSRTRRMWWLAYVASNGVVIEKLIFDPKTFLKFEVMLPPSLEEQAAICEVLDTCDRELRVLEKKLAALKQQKKSLMQKLLTGQVRVKV